MIKRDTLLLSLLYAFFITLVVWAFVIDNARSIERPAGLLAGPHVIMPGMTKDKIISITGVHSGMEKAMIKREGTPPGPKIITLETWYLYFDSTNEKWLVEKCDKCEYWEITFIENKVKSVRVLTKSQ